MDFSIVIPVYNNSNTLVYLHQSLLKIISEYSFSFEIIYVEDFSTDNSLEILKEIKRETPFVKIIQLAYNHTQQVSLYVGMKHATGKYAIFMSADLQEELSLVNKYIEYTSIHPSADLLIGYRTTNKDYLIFRLLSRLFYKIIRLKIKNIPENGFDTICIEHFALQRFLTAHRNNSFLQAELVKSAKEVITVPYIRLKSSNDKLNIRGLLSKIKYFVLSLYDVYFGNKDTSPVKYEIKAIL